MRFTEFSIPESTEWMEKSDILFLLDCCNHKTPFVNKVIFDPSKHYLDDPYHLILDRIHPDDLEEFKKIIEGRSARPAYHKLRIIDNLNRTQLFSFHKLKVSGSKSKELLLAISQQTYQEPIMVKVPVNW